MSESPLEPVEPVDDDPSGATSSTLGGVETTDGTGVEPALDRDDATEQMPMTRPWMRSRVTRVTRTQLLLFDR